jgi:hypothetical protein
MIVRTIDGNIQIVKRSSFKNDLSYYSYIYKLIKPYANKYNKFISLNIKS